MEERNLRKTRVGLVALEPAWITSAPTEDARIAMRRYIQRRGKVRIEI